jgi:hypothetical protein
MRSFRVETFLPREAQSQCRVRFDRVIRVPEEGTCLFLFEAASAREAALVAELAGLGPFRVVEDARRATG